MKNPKCIHAMCHSESEAGPPNLCADCAVDAGATYDGESCEGCFERLADDAEREPDG